jgi:Heparinase II/III-like protein/Heparinase II/III N-terminus
MSPSEVGWRISDQVRRKRWASRQVVPHAESDSWILPAGTRVPESRESDSPVEFRPFPASEILRGLPGGVRQEVIATAEELLAGRWELLGAVRRDMEHPDWFFDPVTGRRAPQFDYCFNVNHRSEDVTGNVKQVWELSRMHHVTILAAAFALSGDDRYAVRAAAHLRSWWAQNPFLSGVHWTSGIETGVRLIAWVWVRRLLDGWDGAAELFERNPVALAQIWWHQYYLASFRSRGSSANNHVIAEAAGLLVAALAFDWFAESSSWSQTAAGVLERELTNNTFPSGVNREMAFEYHGLVTELAVVAAVEADWFGRPLSRDAWTLLNRMFDVVAATMDVKHRPPRQGDGDSGRALVLDPPTSERSAGLLAIGESVLGAATWWPTVEPTVTSTVLASMVDRHEAEHPGRRPCHYGDAGLTLLRSSSSDGPEIWCRCNAGPHGFLAIAAHAHADALAIEVRYDGVDVLADPGTYCYHGEASWRSYFRSTIAHNTIEVNRRDQSASGGPFLWTDHARSRVIGLEADCAGEVTTWTAEHDGYRSLTPSLIHRRSVHLASRLRRLEIVDTLESHGRHRFRLAFHLGPDVQARLAGRRVELNWSGEPCVDATLLLPEGPSWSLSRGATDPILGWYSARFGEIEPAWAVTGEGTCTGSGSDIHTTVLRFHS